MEPVLTAETVIERALRRGARHVRILSVAEGALALALAAGGFLFFEIILDHLFGIGAGVRTALFVALVTLVGVVFGWLVLAPLVRSVSRLYIAKRIEAAFPDFKNSLVTFVELRKSGDDKEIVRLVAHQAAMRFEGVDIDAGLDSTRFVRLGYCFVALVAVVFAYSLFTPKSMWTSLMRAVYPNAGIAAPTSTHIGGVEPGNARVLLGADVEVSAEVTGGGIREASIRWSRDGELWQSAPMQEVKERFAGVLGHVETNTLYYISAGDASSSEYTITTLVPPLVESVEVELTPPAYTGLEPVRAAGGNIEAPAGSQAAIEIGSNKELSSVAIKTSAGQTLELAVSGRRASGKMPVERSGRYAVILTDSEGLSPARPVEYDIVAIPDRPPLVGVKGPSEKDAVGLDEALGFEFEASDDYGLARLVFHFESNPSNANVKNFILPEGKKEAKRSADLVPRLLGATAGDTVSYYLEAFDGQDGKPNASRTATYTFKVAAGRESLSPSTAGAAIPGVKGTNSTLPGTAVAASGEAARKSKGETNLAAPADSPNAKPAGDPKGELLKMLDKDRETWDTIAKHYEAIESPSGAEMPKAAEKQIADGTKVTEAEGAPSPGSGSESAAGTGAAGGSSAAPSEKSAQGGRGSDQASAEAAGETGGRKTVPSENAAQTSAPGGETATGETATAETAPGAPAAKGQEKNGQGVEEKRQTQGGEKGAPLDGETVASAKRESSGDVSKRPGSKGGDATKDTQGGASREPAAGGGQSRQGPEQGSDTQKGGESEGSAAKAESGGSKAAASPSGSAASEQSKQGSPAEAPKGAEGQSSGSSGSGSGISEAAGAAAQGGGKGSAKGKPQEANASKQAEGGGSQGKSGQGEAGGSKAETGGGASSTPGASGGTRGARPVNEAAPVTGEKAPLEPRSAGVTKSDEARIAATRDLVNRLAREIATGRVDAGVMKDLGWQPSDLRTFVRKYADALAELAPAPFEGQITIEGGIDAGEVRQGERGAGAVGSVDTRGNAAKEVTGPTGDKIPREEVAPQYRKTVDEYYRSLAETGK
jgi:hypothetical protein